MDQRLACPLIFVHMYKAGGTSLRQVVRKQHSGAKIQIFKGDFHGSTEWRSLPQAERDSFDLLIGHQHYGQHQFISRQATYMTMLREPVERVLSYFFCVKRFKNHHLYKHGFTDETTLAEFVGQARHIELDNIQTRLLNPQPDKQYPFGSVNEDMFETAMKNLESIERVGTVERMNDFLELLRCAEGWIIPEAPLQNRTADRPKADDQPEEIIERIRELNRFDALLYEAARDRFERDWAQCQTAVSN